MAGWCYAVLHVSCYRLIFYLSQSMSWFCFFLTLFFLPHGGFGQYCPHKSSRWKCADTVPGLIRTMQGNRPAQTDSPLPYPDVKAALNALRAAQQVNAANLLQNPEAYIISGLERRSCSEQLIMPYTVMRVD